MADIERLTIVFPEPMAAQIRAAVEAGDYASTSEAVRDAVRLWSERRENRVAQLEVLRRAWDEGKASGIAGPLNLDDLLKEVRHERRGG